MSPDSGGDIFRCRGGCPPPQGFSLTIHHTDMRQLLGHIQTDKLFHCGFLYMGLLFTPVYPVMTARKYPMLISAGSCAVAGERSPARSLRPRVARGWTA